MNFEFGIPLFNSTAKFSTSEFSLDADKLNQIDYDKKFSQIIFKKHSENSYMFRESLKASFNTGRIGLGILVRRMLYINEETSQIKVQVILNTFPILYFLLLVWYSFEESFLMPRFLFSLAVSIVSIAYLVRFYKKFTRIVMFKIENYKP